MINLTDAFRRLADEWRAHCRRLGGRPGRAVLDHPAFDGLVALGPAVVPDIMEHCWADASVPWELVLREATGVPAIDDPDHFDPREARRRFRAWWAGVSERYYGRV